ncbi:unnamed protein product [Arctogadus glacialis]
MCSILLPSGYVRAMQHVCWILLPSGYVGAAYVLKICNNIQVLVVLFSCFLSENVCIPSLSARLAQSSAQSDEAQGAVIGPNGVAGWDKVQDPAAYLVGLREASCLTQLQVTLVIQLWRALPDCDKKRVNYQPRHQERLPHGRFKAPKRSGVTPGVESVKRCLIGHPGGPAQWPATSRLVEAMCKTLCTLHKTTTKKAGVSTPRWS